MTQSSFIDHPKLFDEQFLKGIEIYRSPVKIRKHQRITFAYLSCFLSLFNDPGKSFIHIAFIQAAVLFEKKLGIDGDLDRVLFVIKAFDDFFGNLLYLGCCRNGKLCKCPDLLHLD